MMNNKKVSIRVAIYCLAYGLLLAKLAISNTTFIKYIDIRANGFKFINVIAIILIALKILKYDVISAKKVIVTGFLSILFLLSFISTSYNNVIMLLILIIGAYGIDIKSIVKCHFYVYGFIMILALVSSMIGLIEDYTVIRSSTNAIRHSLGNTYPTDFAAGILYLEFDLAFLKRRGGFKDSLFFLLVDLIVYRFTNANNFIIGGVILSISMFIFSKYKEREKKRNVCRQNRFFHKLVALSFPVCAILSFVIVKIYQTGNSLLYTIDKIISYRIGFSSKAINEYGIKPFGINIYFIGAGWNTDSSKSYFYVDNGYIYTALMYGMVLLILICLIHSICTYELGKLDLKIAVIYLVIALTSLFEPRFSNYLYNAFLLFVGPCLFKKRTYDIT